jgi:two-component system, NtrC family, response regulator GlrR
MLELRATDFITPPFTPASILPRVWRLLRHNASGAVTRGTLQEKMAMQRLGMIGQSPVFLDEIKKLSLLARCDITVMIAGETGTGKELIARAVHYLSPRSDRPFVPIDCGAIPPELTESELFGHERGAFTGAITKNLGLISAADQGTLFLDEVDALSLSVQAKLLRFLQEMEYRPLGSSEIKKVDVRVISATNRDLLQRVHTNEFRKDLYYRLNVVQLRLPSLRQRREDIVLLARHFVAKYVARFNQPQREFSTDAIQTLLTYHWPGNIRELENVVGAAVALCDGPLIRASDLLLAGDQMQSPASFREAKAQIITEFEREYIVRLLGSCEGNVSEAARAAGKNRRAFWELIRKHRIDVRGLRPASGGGLTRKANTRTPGFATG